MILPGGPLKVFVATRPVDFRKGVDGLAALAQERLRLDAFSGVVLVFRAKRADRVKILLWDGSGMVLIAKRLDDGKFAWPPVSDASEPVPRSGARGRTRGHARRGRPVGRMRLSSAQLAALFEGLDWRRVHARRTTRPAAAG